jgi:hypothetical protein
VKYWVREYDGGRRDPTELSRTVRPPSDTAEAVSKILSEQAFSSTKYVAAQLRRNLKLVKRILIEVFGTKNSVCDRSVIN